MDRPHPYQNGCDLSIGANPGDLFAPFGSLQKGLAAGAAKRPLNQKAQCKTGGRGKPLPYGCERVQMGRAGLGPAPTAAQGT